jgi:LacI family transcriptional regulator
MGAVKALREAGRRVPEDVSVIGWDDIQGAAFHNPKPHDCAATLRQMGVVAAETLLKRITSTAGSEYPKEIVLEPELVVRESTAQKK